MSGHLTEGEAEEFWGRGEVELSVDHVYPETAEEALERPYFDAEGNEGTLDEVLS